MKKILFIFSLLMIVFIPKIIYAQDIQSFNVVSYSDEDVRFAYTVVGDGGSTPSNMAYAYTGRKLSVYLFGGVMYLKGGIITGTYEWENPEYVIQEGEQTVTLNFINFSNHKWSAQVYVYGIKDPHVTKQPMNDPIPSVETSENGDVSTTEEPTPTPSLTASTLILSDSAASYDINVNDKIADSDYSWSSSNTKVAKVNSSTGVVTAVSDGKAKVTCNITTPDNETITLASTVVVGESDDYPILSDESLDLDTGDSFDLDVTNQIAKSKYKFLATDKSIVKINSTNGKLTALKEGSTTVKCIVTAPNKSVYVLQCEINVSK